MSPPPVATGTLSKIPQPLPSLRLVVALNPIKSMTLLTPRLGGREKEKEEHEAPERRSREFPHNCKSLRVLIQPPKALSRVAGQSGKDSGLALVKGFPPLLYLSLIHI